MRGQVPPAAGLTCPLPRAPAGQAQAQAPYGLSGDHASARPADSLGDLTGGTAPTESCLQSPGRVAGLNADTRTTGTASPLRRSTTGRRVPRWGSGAAVACWRGTQAAGRPRVSPPPGASRPAAGASLA